MIGPLGDYRENRARGRGCGWAASRAGRRRCFMGAARTRGATSLRLMHDQLIDHTLNDRRRFPLFEIIMPADLGWLPEVAAVGFDMNGPAMYRIPLPVTFDPNEDGSFIPAATPETVLGGLGNRDAEDIFDRTVLNSVIVYQREPAFDLHAYLEAAEEDTRRPIVGDILRGSTIHIDIELTAFREATGHGYQPSHLSLDQLPAIEIRIVVGVALQEPREIG